jgi:osmotically-inducible protein OsmY
VVDDLEVKPGQPSENSDAWLTAKVKAALLFHRHVSAATTEVETRDGVVTLKGKASNQAQKDLTAECAKDVDGVKAVDNQMTVAAGEDKGRTVGDRMDDASVTAQVKSALLFHRSTRMVATKVKTRGGVVTLSGEARSAAEKDLLTRLAQGINGVRSVRNNMVVRK